MRSLESRLGAGELIRREACRQCGVEVAAPVLHRGRPHALRGQIAEDAPAQDVQPRILDHVQEERAVIERADTGDHDLGRGHILGEILQVRDERLKRGGLEWQYAWIVAETVIESGMM